MKKYNAINIEENTILVITGDSMGAEFGSTADLIKNNLPNSCYIEFNILQNGKPHNNLGLVEAINILHETCIANPDKLYLLENYEAYLDKRSNRIIIDLFRAYEWPENIIFSGGIHGKITGSTVYRQLVLGDTHKYNYSLIYGEIARHVEPIRYKGFQPEFCVGSKLGIEEQAAGFAHNNNYTISTFRNPKQITEEFNGSKGSALYIRNWIMANYADGILVLTNEVTTHEEIAIKLFQKRVTRPIIDIITLKEKDRIQAKDDIKTI